MKKVLKTAVIGLIGLFVLSGCSPATQTVYDPPATATTPQPGFDTYSFTGTIQQISQSCADNEPEPNGDVSRECNLVFDVEILTDDNGIFFFDTATLPNPAPNVLLNTEALVGEPVEIVQEKTPETYFTPSGELLNVWKVQSWQLIPRD